MIDVSTPILGPVDCGADQIISAVYRRSGAPKYDRQQVETIAKGLIHWTDVFNLRTSVVAGQILHETGYFRYGGDVRADQFNFAGLGATGGIPGAGFPTIDAGIIAVCAHHLVYVLGPKEHWPEHLRQYADRDPRYQAVISAGTAGSVTVLGDHRGKWAYPGTTYPERVRDAANLILSQPRNEEPAMGLIDLIGQRIAAHGREVHNIISRMPTDGQYSRYSGANPTHTAVHYTAVNRLPDSLEAEANSWIGHARYHVNTHGWPGIAYTIGISPSGRVFLLGEAERWRFHVFNDNPRAFPVSNDLGPNQEPTEAMLESLRVVLSVLHTETPEFPNLHRGTTYGHLEFASIGDSRNQTSCPGKLLPFVQRYRTGASIELIPPPGGRVDPVTGCTIIGGIRAYVEWLESQVGADDALLILGRPISNEYQHDGMTVQDFERARLEHHPGTRPDRWDILLGRVNAELKETA